jgi:hypothetical protein
VGELAAFLGIAILVIVTPGQDTGRRAGPFFYRIAPPGEL